MYEERKYRELMKSSSLNEVIIVEGETDLFIQSTNKFKKHDEIIEIRKVISDYILLRPEFKISLNPIDLDETAPKLINHMIKASAMAGVGPMATVAGAVSHYLGSSMDDSDIMIENGGDIYLKSSTDKVISVYAGKSEFSNKIGVKIKSVATPLGICTSAGTIGHSLSYGSADAVVVISKDTLLADACATSIGNKVNKAEDIESAIEFGNNIKGILGIVIIIDGTLGAWGDVELVKI